MAYTDRAEEADRPHRGGASNANSVVAFERPEKHLVEEPSPLALARLIEGEIIPRLLMAHRSGANRDVIPMNSATIDDDEIDRFAHQVMTADLANLAEHIELRTRRGVTVETVYFDLLSPAAKRLGEMWENDECEFTDVTIGLCRLQQLVYEFADRVHVENGSGDGRTALFALTPGDHHSFGLVLVVEYFRRAGWRTVCMPDATEADLIDTVRSERFDLIGFSMADAQWLDRLPPVISRVRKASRNRDMKVIVGGRAFEQRPDRVAMVGADETAGDAREAVHVADALLGRRQSAPC